MWQPIETAPKDGRWLLLRQHGNTKPHIGCWCEAYSDGEYSRPGRWEKDGEGLPLDDITGWMPLPEVE